MKEVISRRQAVSILVFFVFGSTIIVGVSSEAGQDSWFTQLLSAALALPVVMIYARLIRLFPGKNLFDIFLALYGEIWGRVLILLMAWYALHLSGLVINNFSGFMKIIVMPETPILPIMIIFLLAVVYMVISGIETLAKWCLVILPITVAFVFLTTLLSLRQMDFTNILPLFEHSLGEISATAYKSLTFPYAETVVFLCVADSVNKQDSPYRIYSYGILISTLFMIIIILRNIELMGPALLGAIYFPSYVAVRLIKVGDFLQRIEGTLSMSFIFVGIAKTSLCLLAAVKGTAAFFKLTGYRRIVLPMSLLVLSVSAVLYKSIMEMFEFVEYYQYYVIPFQFGIPVFVWITAEYQKRHGDNSSIIKQEG